MATVTKEERDKLYNEYKFSFGSDGYINKYIGYLHTFWPERVYDLGRLRDYDKEMSMRIKDLEKIIEDLKVFRRMYADRYNELCGMHSVPVVKLKRYKDDYVTYTMTTCRRLDNGQEIEVKYKNYDGKDRRQAIADYEKYVKEHPGIIAEKDIAKGKWEK